MKEYLRGLMRRRLQSYVGGAARWPEKENDYLWLFLNYVDGLNDVLIVEARIKDAIFVDYIDARYVFKSLVEYRKGAK